MNRRTALLASMFLGGLIPRSLRAQSPGRRLARREQTAGLTVGESDTAGAGAGAAAVDSDLPDAFPQDHTFSLKKWPISGYTRIPNHQAPPEKALIDWIFLRTGTAEWHGDRPAALWANRNYLYAYNSPEVLKQVGDIVERFTQAVEDLLTVHVQLVAAVDPRWRYTVYSRLTYVGGGPQGQQIWTMKSDDAALVLSQMQVQQGFRPLARGRLEMINGQTVRWRTLEERTFVGGLQRDSTVGLSFQPRPEKLNEGIVLKFSPLLTFEGTGVDAKIDLTVNTLRSLHRTRVIAPREVGNAETSIDVPDATETHLEQTVKNWPLGQTLVIACGIHPGILDKKGGWLNLPIPGTYPTGTEVLLFLDVNKVQRPRATRDVDSRDVDSRTPSRRRSRADADFETGPVGSDSDQ